MKTQDLVQLYKYREWILDKIHGKKKQIDIRMCIKYHNELIDKLDEPLHSNYLYN